MFEGKIKEVLNQLGQSHLLDGMQQLSSHEMQLFLAQLHKYNPRLLAEQRELVGKVQQPHPDDLPCHYFERSGNSQDYSRGEELVRQGKVGCLILAGGQGTRLGFDGPKGTIPVTPTTGKSLFQLFCERTGSAGKNLPICIMTSCFNHKQTVEFFESHGHFGLNPSQVSFFKQGELPFVNDDGHWLLERSGKIAEGPDGNGHALRLFYDLGLWEKWNKAGVEYLNIIFVDNALADPFDPEFVGFTARHGVDAALKAVMRLSPDEKMGVLVERKGKLAVIEYSEVPSNGSEYPLSSTGMFCLSMQFIQYLCGTLKAEFPLHLARKQANLGGDMHIWKCERFIFDLLAFARSSAVFVCPREKIYAPLKNATGDKSLETVKKALAAQGLD